MSIGAGWREVARTDVPAGLVVFLVAVPLCLGIAQASGAPLLSGLIAGIVGGTVVTALSGSPLSVSGPAAGLAVLVAAGIGEVGLRPFLLAVVLAGLMQVGMGLARLGGIAHYFPSSVIKGMLAAIGVLILLKQIPHALGYDHDYEGDLSFAQLDGENTIDALFSALQAFSPAAIIVSVACAMVMFTWPALQRVAPLKLIPPALVAVTVGAGAVFALSGWWPEAIDGEHMVQLPRFESVGDVLGAMVLPDFTRVADPAVWRIGVTLALVASLETLLCIEAVDRLDPHRRITPPNRELVAQGVGNVVSGLAGGLPITSVIVRSSANVQAGARTRLSAWTHGVSLLVGLLFFVPVLNSIPLAALAVVLIFVGAKLTSPSIWKQMWDDGPGQFVPFAITVVAVIVTDLLVGTLIGLAVGLLVSIRNQQRDAMTVGVSDGRHVITFRKDMTFLQKARLKEALRQLPDGSQVVVDRRAAHYVDEDIEEILADFFADAPSRAITARILGPVGVAPAAVDADQARAAG